jgi:endo-1,3(4)-beta-glucanase
MKKTLHLVTCFLLCMSFSIQAQFVSVGSGGYTTSFPGMDSEGRNAFPPGTPQISGNAAGKPVPTNDWWSSLIKYDHTNNLFNYPLALRTVNEGLVVSYIVPSSGPNGSSEPMDDTKPVTVGVSGINAAKCTVADYSDWTVTMNWNDGTHNFSATAGIAMPFLYFAKNDNDVAQISVSQGTVSIDNEMLVITNSKNGSDYAVYAPSGSTWIKNGSVYTSGLNGKNYWSIAFLPPTAPSIPSVAAEYKKYAYVFPSGTTVSWKFDESTSKMTTVFKVKTEVKEGSDTCVLMGLLPHQWAHLAQGSNVPAGYIYPSIRGQIKTLAANSFSVENTFHGILPTLPNLPNYSQGYNPAKMEEKISMIENEGLATWTDSYNEGQVMNRLIQTARIAGETGDTAALNKIVLTVKERMEDWLKAESGEVAFLFYYNTAWSALLGYPAGHGQDNNINDHHFHWGYFINAAAFLEQYSPGWADDWGAMVDLLVRDAASADRNDPMFPFLRSFSPYAGHCWANGFATFPMGNDQESTSESMQFNTSLINWGTITGNKTVRDLGIYLYTTEQTAIEEYWLDKNERSFKPGYNFSLASRIWGNGYDNQTFWTGDIEAAYGIELYPVHGGSLYLGQDTVYVKKLWDEICSNTGILSNEANPNLWHDIMWEYLSFIDPEKAIQLYDSYPERTLKFGVSDAQTYYWLHSMNALGRVNVSITADYPMATSFYKNGVTTYVAQNFTSVPLTVSFSDGYTLEVPAHRLATNRDTDVSGVIASDFDQAFPGGSVNLKVITSGTGIDKVEIFDGNALIGTPAAEPFTLKASGLGLGIHKFYAKIYKGNLFSISNIISVRVGSQVPYTGYPAEIPGTIEAGLYDSFEGGPGQGISYLDVSRTNEGDFRTNEYADAGMNAIEGATIGWISGGEWLEYTVDVKTPGIYDLNARYSSGNTSGGGPFHVDLDGMKISADISMPYTGGWDTWKTMNIKNLELTPGIHILRAVFDNGEFNLGKMSFDYKSPLAFIPPVADAGENIRVLLPLTSGSLDGSKSTGPGGQVLNYQWKQVYGPSMIIFSDSTDVSPDISNLEKGIYECSLRVGYGSYYSESTVKVIVTELLNLSPFVGITSPQENSSFYMGKTVVLYANATDLDGSIAGVSFYDGEELIGEVSAFPFKIDWTASSIGLHSVTAVATDSDGSSSVSAPVGINITSPPSCEGGPKNGDFTYRFTPDKNNPFLTFIPSASGTGSPTCILYYGTASSGPYPGYPVKPNVPYRITATEGSTVYFYYTYSFSGGEKNNSDALLSYEIGSCTGSDPYLTVIPAVLSVKGTANSKASFTVDTNVDCSVLSDQSWLTVSADTVSKYTTITVTAEANPLAIQRTAHLNISGNGVTSKTVTVNQAAGTTSVSLSGDEGISIYPDPAGDEIFIKGISGKTQAGIYDVCGNLVMTKELYPGTEKIDLVQLGSGVYMIRLQTGKNAVIRRFVKR